MNPVSSSKIVSLLLFVLVPVWLAKMIWSGVMIFLEKSPIQPMNAPFVPSIPTYAFSKLFFEEGAIQNGSKSEAVYPLEGLELKAIWRSGLLGFVVVKDGAKTEFVRTKEGYKGYVLGEIYPDKAVFLKDSGRYELLLDKKSAAGKGPGDGFATSFEVARGDLEEYLQNMEKIWNNISISPVGKGAGFKGFRIDSVAEGSIFETLGLRAGDIIKAANNKVFSGPKDALDLFKQVRTIDVLTLTIQRGAKEAEFVYEIR